MGSPRGESPTEAKSANQNLPDSNANSGTTNAIGDADVDMESPRGREPLAREANEALSTGIASASNLAEDAFTRTPIPPSRSATIRNGEASRHRVSDGDRP
eukprot:GHVU01112252.1.p1 GENE.GHVU01112252.1~~GHVU01112252.1.p1  ORF type:complete len:101 (+),score=6.02 GHVU01112252.1:266-568(+)